MSCLLLNILILPTKSKGLQAAASKTTQQKWTGKYDDTRVFRLSINLVKKINPSCSETLDTFLQQWNPNYEPSNAHRVKGVPLINEVQFDRTLLYQATDKWNPAALVQQPVKAYNDVFYDYTWATDVPLIDYLDLYKATSTTEKVAKGAAAVGLKGLLTVRNAPARFKESKIVTREKVERFSLAVTKYGVKGNLAARAVQLGKMFQPILQSTDDAPFADDQFWVKRQDLFDWRVDDTKVPEFAEFKAAINDLPTKTKFGISGIVAAAITPPIGKALGVLQTLTKRKEGHTDLQYLMQRVALSEYFQMPPELLPIAINMERSWFNQESKVSKAPLMVRMLSAAIAGTGPFYMKMFQDIGQDSPQSDDSTMSLSELTKAVFSNVPPLSTEEAKYLRDNVTLHRNKSGFFGGTTKVPVEIKWPDDPPKCLKAASVAQTCWVTHEGQEAVLKFIKPSAAFLFLTEMYFLLTRVWKRLGTEVEVIKNETGLSMNPNVVVQARRLILSLVTGYCAEFDVNDECAALSRGKVIYPDPIKVVDCLGVCDSPAAILMSKADGIPLSAWFDANPSADDAKALYNELVKLLGLFVVGAMITGKGFHTDLHPGNIFVSKDNKVSLIDFGGFGLIAEANRKKLLAVLNYGEKIKGACDANPSKVGAIRHFVYGLNYMCNIPLDPTKPDPNAKETDAIIGKLRQYYNMNKAAFIGDAMKMALSSFSNLGTCGQLDMIMYGRGMGYLTTSVDRVQALAPNASPYTLESATKTGLGILNFSESTAILKTAWSTFFPPDWKEPLLPMAAAPTAMPSEVSTAMPSETTTVSTDMPEETEETNVSMTSG